MTTGYEGPMNEFWRFYEAPSPILPNPLYALSELCMALLVRLSIDANKARDQTSMAGRITRKHDPCPGTLFTSIRPPCACTSLCTIVSPIPEPPVARERERSARQKRVKIWSKSLGSIPIPVSVTSMIASLADPVDLATVRAT